MHAYHNYKKTSLACYLGFITQAIAANYAPLLFLTFKSTYAISLDRIALIPMIFFLTQLLTDLAAVKFVDRIGYRTCVVASQILSAIGLISMSFLPELLPIPFMGILVSVVLYAIGSGLIEVLISPIVEACPFENKEGMMSLLHSFYCWGSVGVILGSTIFFAVFMGVARVLYGKANEKLDLTKVMLMCGTLCVICYLVASLATIPILGLIGCALCGFSVGIMWPGTLSISAQKCPAGGTAMFAFLALAGDLGGSIGPSIVGIISNLAGGNLKIGLLTATFFPIVLILGLFILKKYVNKSEKEEPIQL